MELPLVSIALCTYNGEKHLRTQLDTLINQTYKNIEIVAVDDCSSDSSFEILKEYSKDKRVRAFRNDKNLGFIKNFEKAISLCSGEMVALSDQDDVWDLTKIEIMVNASANCILVYHNSSLIDPNGNSTGKKINDFVNFPEGNKPLNFLYGNSVPGHAIFFKRSLLKHILPIPASFFHDWWILFVTSCMGKIGYIDRCLVMYRQHGGTQTDLFNFKRTRTSGPLAMQLHEEKLLTLLERIKTLKEFEFLPPEDKTKIIKAEKLYKQKADSFFSISLLIFLLSNFKSLHYIRKKSFLSKLLFAFKDSVGHRAKKLIK